MQEFLVGMAAFLVGLLVGLAVWIRAKGRGDGEVSQLKARLATLEAEKKSEQEKLQWVGSAQETLREAFNALAGDALKSNAQALTAEAKKDIDGVVKPMREQLTTLSDHVRELEKQRVGAYRSIQTELSHLRETHGKLQQSTVSLAQALRSPTVRGRWGEIELRRIVEMAGMERHVAFDEQATTDAGRPDMIVHLTHCGVLPVDSKVPLDAYLSAMEASDEGQQRHYLDLHAKAVRSRVNDLGQKRYWDQFQPSPDFVVMFVPNEACLGAAFSQDATLLEHAIDKRVLICSPVTLLALLRTVAFGWQQHQITENAIRIAEEGKELFRRVQTFANHLESVGSSLGKSVDAYNKAVASFDRRLLPAAQRLQEMGVSEKELEGPEEVVSMPALTRVLGPSSPEE
jgi:DNA recombination protein RmuC